MTSETVYQLRPLGWETDPEEEWFQLSTLDYLAAATYNTYGIFFRMADEHKEKAIETVKAGLERTLSQARHLCGTLEKDLQGRYAFLKKRNSTVRLVVHRLDAPEIAGKYPSFDDLAKSHFTSASLGDLAPWTIPLMTYGERPEARLDASPIVSGFKINFVRGGMVFCMANNHYANDVLGWAAFTHQLAENCDAIFHQTDNFPVWDPRCLDLSRLRKPEPEEKDKVDAPPRLPARTDHVKYAALLFHLPKSKASELKALASPQGEESGQWISTYDAYSAFIWRTMTRLRAPMYKPDPSSSNLVWVEAVDMRRRFRDPEAPQRMQGNVMFVAFSLEASVPQPTVGELISGWPLSKLALYVRQMTNSVTPEALDVALSQVAMVRDKSSLAASANAQPPMSVGMTDHRDANMISADFGFGKPEASRHLSDKVFESLILVYGSRNPSPDSDEGTEFSITYEESLMQELIDDPEWSRYFEYRGVDIREK